MKNHIIGIAILACTVLILFTGTASVLGTVSIGAGPELMDIITNAPSGETYSAATILAEIGLDLNPLYWIPDFTAAVMFPDAPHYSTFSKIPRFLYSLQNLNTSQNYRVSIYNSSDCVILFRRGSSNLVFSQVNPGESSTFYTDGETEWDFYVSNADYTDGYYYLKTSDGSDYLYIPVYSTSVHVPHTRTRFFYDTTFYVVKVDDPESIS